MDSFNISHPSLRKGKVVQKRCLFAMRFSYFSLRVFWLCYRYRCNFQDSGHLYRLWILFILLLSALHQLSKNPSCLIN